MRVNCQRPMVGVDSQWQARRYPTCALEIYRWVLKSDAIGWILQVVLAMDASPRHRIPVMILVHDGQFLRRMESQYWEWFPTSDDHHLKIPTTIVPAFPPDAPLHPILLDCH